MGKKKAGKESKEEEDDQRQERLELPTAHERTERREGGGYLHQGAPYPKGIQLIKAREGRG